MPDELKPCLVCGHEKLHIRTTKTTVSMPVSIRCAMCDFTVEMQNWKSLTEWWNSRPHQTVAGDDPRIEIAINAIKAFASYGKVVYLTSNGMVDNVHLQRALNALEEMKVDRQQGKLVFDQTEFMKVMMPFHGGNPGPWYSAMEKVYEEYFSKFAQPSVPSENELLGCMSNADNGEEHESYYRKLAVAVRRLLTEQKG